MTTLTMNYAAKATITITLASLASSATFVAGQESNQVDNTTNKYIDALVQGKITVGTTPTVNTQINVYVWGSDTDITATNLDVLDGADSAETITSAGVRNGLLKLAATLDVDTTTSNRTYWFAPFSVRDLFGQMPKFWGVWVSSASGVALNATAGNHEITYTGIKLDAT